MNTYSHRFYLGPHSPLSVPLSKVMKRNADRLHEIETECPPSGLHREALSEILKLPEAKLVDGLIHELYVDFVLQNDNTRNIIYNYDAFWGSRKSAFKSMTVYPSMDEKIAPLRLLTKAHRATVFLCLQSYADLVEQELTDAPELQQLLTANSENLQFSWVPFVSRFQAVWPEAEVVIINANELAVHWAAIVSLVTGHPKSYLFRGINDLPLMEIEGFGQEPFRTALAANPPKTVGDWLKLSSQAFSDYGYRDPDEDLDIETTWTLKQSQHSMLRFAADIEAFRKMEGVHVASDLVKDFK